MKKYKLTVNLGLKIAAFIFSAFLWLIVVNVDNPVESRTFTDIPVTIVNDDIITSGGEVYQVVGQQTVSVVVYATREVRQQLSAEDIVATADIREMNSSLVPIEVTIPEFEGNYESAEAVPRNLQIQIEKSGSRVLALTADDTGIVRNGYMIGSMTVHPTNITITGPESVLEQIDRAVASVKVDGMSKSEEKNADLILYDSNGNVVSQNQLENNLGEDGLTVSVEILEMKSVPVVFDVTGTPAEGYQYTGCTSEPETLQICGASEDIQKIEEIDVPASVIDISGASGPVEQTVDITPYLPDGIRLVDENTGSVKVTAMIEAEGTRTIDFLVRSLRINNLADNLQVSYPADTEIRLRFSGDQEQLDVLDISNAVSVDLEQYTSPGTYDVPVNVNLPDGITQLENVTVQLTVEEKTDAAENPDSTGNSGSSDNSSSSDNSASQSEEDSETGGDNQTTQRN